MSLTIRQYTVREYKKRRSEEDWDKMWEGEGNGDEGTITHNTRQRV